MLSFSRYAILVAAIADRAAADGHTCTPSDTNLCMKIDVYSGESGYYIIDGKTGVSPDITVQIGKTYVFNQYDHTNWYHPVGFAYYPDGAHGETWGGAERDEVEAKGELLYKINGKPTTCEDAGDTGLDCYEPEFFHPRGEWVKKKYTAELTITQAMADKSHGGVIYYFCHIHSKMSGKIIIQNADGSPVTNSKPEQTLYAMTTNDAFDKTCGTTGASPYADGGAKACTHRFLEGTLDTDFEKCLQAIDCQMNTEMRVKGYDTHANEISTFMQQMIPHHNNAVNMAKLLLKHAPSEVSAVEDLEDILWDIINVQNYQVHQFRAYLADDHGTAVGHHCDEKLGDMKPIAVTDAEDSPTAVAGCTPSDTNICVRISTHKGESGYYEFDGYTGPSPDIIVQIGKTYVFDQRDSSNWFHPLGFAYYPDGAHGETWGGDERDEVEAKGELLYKINGAPTTCEDAGDTGLDCYEPEFFYPREQWQEKKYTVELKITQAMADKSHGGVVYYFCHIHSKMSGKIIIQNADGSPVTKADGSALAHPTEQTLYGTHASTGADKTCGTHAVESYAPGGSNACSERYLCGALDTDFEKCMQAIDCKMNKDMKSQTKADGTDKVATFMQQMIPHHQNAVNMAKILLKSVSPQKITEAIDEDGLTHMLHTIIAAQNYQIHQFRGYLGTGPADAAAVAPYSGGSDKAPETAASSSIMAAFHIMVLTVVAFML